MVLAERYTGRFLPNTSVGGVDISGLERAEAAERVNRAFDEYVGNGFVFIADGQRVVLDRGSFGWNDPDQTNDIVHLDADQTLSRAMERGHRGLLPARALTTAASLVIPARLPLQISLNRAAAADLLRVKLETLQKTVSEPQFKWSEERDKKLAVRVQPGSPGRFFNLDAAIQTMEQDFLALKNEPIKIKSRQAEPTISDSEAKDLAEEAKKIAFDSPLTLVFEDKKWELAALNRARLIAPQKAGGYAKLGIAVEELKEILSPIAAAVEVEPTDAVFEVKNDRVVAFEASRDGKEIDREALISILEKEWLSGQTQIVELAIKTAAPKITTESSNNLGIKEILGVGTSNFAGSPVNRVKNIRNSVRKLNGILIKPGEEFSLLKALQPFTAEGGYLPEKVIKGDRIKPEIGGGACQIGTTTFRAAMMSGLPITQRTSHSLVVKYYSDPRNGNPGTDATIYEPSPDFRFLNDTGNYIFFQALMDEKMGDLRFVFWGTKDGRQGSYSAPNVSKWYPPPAPKEIKTTDLPVGTKECQNAFKGADTSFTYTVEKSDGTKTERVFTSHYRALPQICMIGATPEEVAGQTTDGEMIPTADIPAPSTNTTGTPNKTN